MMLGLGSVSAIEPLHMKFSHRVYSRGCSGMFALRGLRMV